MSLFETPEFLWFLPLAAALAWWRARRQRPALRYSDITLVAGLPTGRVWRAKWGGAALRGLGVVALILAAAGPRRPDFQTRLPAEGVDIVLVLDVSGSMSEADALWVAGEKPVTRLEAAKRAFRLFVAGGDAPDGTHFDPRTADPMGLVTFAAVPQTACPLTLNHSVLLGIADAQTPAVGVDAGTNVGDALAEGVTRLDAAGGGRRKVLILLSDGEHNVSKAAPDNPLKPRQAAQLAANLGVAVYAIDAGGDPPPGAGADVIEQRRAGREALRAVAEMTGGRSFAASSGADLLAAYREIDVLEKVEVTSYSYRRYHEYYPWCAAAAVALLLAAHVLERTRWRVLG